MPLVHLRANESATLMFREIWNARNLLVNLVRRDLTIRYKSTVLGFLWSFLKPLCLTAIFWVVFQYILNVPLRAKGIAFTLHLLAGILAWTFFAGAAGDSLGAVIGNANLIKKVRLPLAVFPLAVVISHLIHFVLALLVLFVLAILMGLPPSPAYALAPALIAMHFTITLAVCLILSALNVFYRDVASIWEIVSQAWFYATPIIYPVYLATEELSNRGWDWMKWLYLANPLAPIIVAYRRIFLYASLEAPAEKNANWLEMPDGQLVASLGLCAAVCGAVLWAGCIIFSHYSRKFADEL